MQATRRAFSLIELLVAIAVIAVLLALLLPALSHARKLSYQVVCANNLRQISVGWTSYVQDNKDTFPVILPTKPVGGLSPKPNFPDDQDDEPAVDPSWSYGGATFRGSDRTPVLASDRPINRYLADRFDTQASTSNTQTASGSSSDPLAHLFRCPADIGVYERNRTVRGQSPPSVLPNRGSCFQTYGNSYRANPFLQNAQLAGMDDRPRALKLHEVQVDVSRLLVLGDSAWFYATRPENDPDRPLEASWHKSTDAGNMLAADGSVRFSNFGAWPQTSEFAVHPRPDLGR